jgi:UDP-N-acetylmuramate dehydrogenase
MQSFGEALACQIRGEIVENCLLSFRTTYKIGGPARYMVSPLDVDDLRQLIGLIRQYQVSFFVLGGGANLLVSDAGFDGVVIQLSHFDSLAPDHLTANPGAGANLDQFVLCCLYHGMVGLESLSGIPGTVGGALRMNAGAFGAEISNYLLSVEIMDYEGNLRSLSKEEVRFGYRQAPAIKESFILGARFEFPLGDVASLFSRREEVLASRKEKQPWQHPSAGSVFKRPAGHYAGQLIEEAGLKGKRIGQAQVSTKHAGFIINLGGASAAEVLELIRLIQSEVRGKFNVELELEQELVGF